jgi:hypothetical protein
MKTKNDPFADKVNWLHQLWHELVAERSPRSGVAFIELAQVEWALKEVVGRVTHAISCGDPFLELFRVAAKDVSFPGVRRLIFHACVAAFVPLTMPASLSSPKLLRQANHRELWRAVTRCRLKATLRAIAEDGRPHKEGARLSGCAAHYALLVDLSAFSPIARPPMLPVEEERPDDEITLGVG